MADEWDRAEQEARAGNGGQDSNARYTPKGNGRRRNRDFKGRLLLSREFMETMHPPDYVIDHLLMAGSTYTLTGNTGHGKTLLALLWAKAVATGYGFAGRICRQGSVVFLAGENPDNVKYQWYALCYDAGIDPSSLPIYWYEGTFSIGEALEPLTGTLRAIPDLRLCIVDSLQAFFMGEDDNQNPAMLDMAIDFRSMSLRHPNRPAVVILAHPTKNARRDSLLPRGGSALTNELDGNLTLWLDEQTATLHWLGKFRGPPFDPIQTEAVVVKPDGLVDADGNQMPCTILRPVMPERAKDLVAEKKKRQVAVLSALRTNPAATQREIAQAANLPKSTAQRLVGDMETLKWVKQYAGKWVITKEGEAVLAG